MEITIQHQEEKTFHKFNVKNPNKLTSKEVVFICLKMGVQSLFVNGRFYKSI
jgi:hypothetical protein